MFLYVICNIIISHEYYFWKTIGLLNYVSETAIVFEFFYLLYTYSFRNRNLHILKKTHSLLTDKLILCFNTKMKNRELSVFYCLTDLLVIINMGGGGHTWSTPLWDKGNQPISLP